MTGYEKWLTKQILITVRTYPVPSRSSIEVSCTAGIDEAGRWIRLFPVQYRWLEQDKRFRKYQVIEAAVTKAASDARPESYKLNNDSIRIISEPLDTANKWEARKARVMPLASPSLCHLQRQWDAFREPTLGFFRPRAISALKIEPIAKKWSEAELARLRQSFFGNAPEQELEKIPFDFSYEFICEDTACNGHKLKCTDWEMGQAYRGWRSKYHDTWQAKFRDRFETEMALVKDTHFFVGTVNNHPSEWIISGSSILQNDVSAKSKDFAPMSDHARDAVSQQLEPEFKGSVY